MPLLQRRRRFSLVELLLVVSGIAIFAAVIMVTVDPNKKLSNARDAQRLEDVQTILNAVYQYSIENQGVLPDTITTVPTEICRSGVNVDCETDQLVNLNMLTGSSLLALPADPKSATKTSTHYTIVKTDQRVTVSAPGAEEVKSPIEATR